MAGMTPKRRAVPHSLFNPRYGSLVSRGKVWIKVCNVKFREARAGGFHKLGGRFQPWLGQPCFCPSVRAQRSDYRRDARTFSAWSEQRNSLVQHWLLQIFSISSTVDNWGSRQSFSSSCWWGHFFSAKRSQELRHWYSTATPPVGEKNQSVSLMWNSMKQSLTLLQSGFNPMGRFSLGLVGHSKWADWRNTKKPHRPTLHRADLVPARSAR